MKIAFPVDRLIVLPIRNRIVNIVPSRSVVFMVFRILYLCCVLLSVVYEL